MMKLAALTVLIGAIASKAFADAPPPKLLTWNDCVVLALEKNSALLSSRYSVEAGKASYKGSFNGLLPTLTAQNSHNDSNTSTPATNKWNAQYTAGINLFSASAIAGIRSASASLLQAEASQRQTSASLRFSLRQAFAQQIFAQQDVEVTRTILDIRKRDAEMVTLRYDSGRESKGNMMRAKAQVKQAEADYAQAQRTVRLSQKTLDQQLGLDDFTVVYVTGTLDIPPAPGSSGDSLYLDGRPDVALQRALIKSAEASVSTARAPLWPTLTGNYTRTRSSTYEFPATLYGWTANMTLSIPLFSGGPAAVYYAVQSAKDNLAKTNQDLRTVVDAAIVDLETQWIGYASAVDQVGVQSALLTAARQRNDEADVRYASGLLTYDNWEIIASDRISSEKQAINSAFNAAVAQASWEKSIGKELGE